MASTINVRLTPRGGRNDISSWNGALLIARVSSPPVDGSANIALIALLSTALHVRKSAIMIVTGEHSREKCIQIDCLTQGELHQMLIRFSTE